MSIKSTVIAATLAAPIAIAGCTGSPQETRQVAGTVIGGTAGLATAKALGLGDGWVAVSTLAGAAAGTVIARNQNNNQCAYADGNGGYRRGPC